MTRTPSAGGGSDLLCPDETLLAALTLAVVSAIPAAAATLGVEKRASVEVAEPGTEFRYTIVANCSGLTEACIGATVTDTLPAGLDVTSLPLSTPERQVAYDRATRLLTVTFRIPLPPPSPARLDRHPGGLVGEHRARGPATGRHAAPRPVGRGEHRHPQG